MRLRGIRQQHIYCLDHYVMYGRAVTNIKHGITERSARAVSIRVVHESQQEWSVGEVSKIDSKSGQYCCVKQTAVTAYFSSKQLLLFVFTQQSWSGQEEWSAVVVSQSEQQLQMTIAGSFQEATNQHACNNKLAVSRDERMSSHTRIT